MGFKPALAGTAHFQWEYEATGFQPVEYSLCDDNLAPAGSVLKLDIIRATQIRID
jgi:hypothetical protein